MMSEYLAFLLGMQNHFLLFICLSVGSFVFVFLLFFCLLVWILSKYQHAHLVCRLCPHLSREISASLQFFYPTSNLRNHLCLISPLFKVFQLLCQMPKEIDWRMGFSHGLLCHCQCWDGEVPLILSHWAPRHLRWISSIISFMVKSIY